MEQGDFTRLAKDYIHRTGYSRRVLGALASYLGAHREKFVVADVGAGTGKLTEVLLDLGLRGFSVEPNDAMREEGMRLHASREAFGWSKGTAEETGLATGSVDWVLMGSSFHWTDAPRALAEFHRILRPGGAFTALWNPRDLERNELQATIDANIQKMVPTLKRVSSGSKVHTEGIDEKLSSTGHFDGVLFMEAPHEQLMDRDRYLGAWRSVNDIQAQAGAETFQRIMTMIEGLVAKMDRIVVPYKTRAWTVHRRNT